MSNTPDFCKSPDYLAVTGSHLYGYAVPSSDIDRRGFVVPPAKYREGLKPLNFSEWEDSDSDTVVYNLSQFMIHCAKGNTNCLESLFATDYQATTIGKLIRDNRSLFVTKAYYPAIKGFALSELRKARCVSLVESDKNTTICEQINALASSLHLKSYERQEIIEIIAKYRPDLELFVEKPTENLGEKRQEGYNKFGYSPKNAAHAIRLLNQGIELLTTGNLTFPLKNATYLLDIRTGIPTIEDIVSEFDRLIVCLDKALEDSFLPSKPDYEQLNELYLKVCKMTDIKE